ncbi:MAG: PqqD family protein [Croceibacterium sp.]
MTGPITKLTANYSETAIEDEVVLLNLDSGDFFSLKGTARHIWELIDGVRTRDAILAELARSYHLQAEALAPDVDGYLAELSTAGLIAR